MLLEKQKPGARRILEASVWKQETSSMSMYHSLFVCPLCGRSGFLADSVCRIVC